MERIETKKKGKQEGELEVTGVSRSGRVRKKSSKLMDFESSDDVLPEKRPYTKKAEQVSPNSLSGPPPPRRGRPPSQHSPLKASYAAVQHQQSSVLPPEYPHQQVLLEGEFKTQNVMHHSLTMPEDYFHTEPGAMGGGGSSTVHHPPAGGGTSRTSSGGSGSGVTPGSHASEGDEFDGDSSLDTESIGSDFNDSLLIDDHEEEIVPEEPLLMMDGKPAPKKRGPKPSPRKNIRKDKGKARFTAYMLWAKQIRQKLISTHSDMDFSQVSKKLGELWHTVPSSEKYSWKRQADRLAARYSQKVSKRGGGTTGGGGTQRTKSTAAAPPPLHSKATMNRQTVEAVIETRPSPPDPPPRALVKPTLPSDLFKVTGTAPLDLAAHLRLLGDNLTIIGERLKDHEGRMAISGSMSLLMDSFLCALGPLICLTSHVSELNACPQELLTHILDNIAYIMPGL